MKKVHVLNRPTSVDDIDAYYDDMDDGAAWQPKAERARVRRWRQLKRQIT